MGFNVQFCRVVLFVFPFLCLFVFFLKYNVIIIKNQNPWFLNIIETVHLFHGFQCPIWSCYIILFPFPCVFAGERQRTVSSAKAEDVSGLRACFSFLCRRKVAQVSSLSVCIIIFLCRRK